AMENFRKHANAICKDHGLRETFAVYARKNGNNVIQPGATMRRFHHGMIARQPPQTVEKIRKLLQFHAKRIKQGGKQCKSLMAMLKLLSAERAKPVPTSASSPARQRAFGGEATKTVGSRPIHHGSRGVDSRC